MASTAFAPYDDEGKAVLGIVIDKSTRVCFSNIPLSEIELHGAEALKSHFAKFGPIQRYTLFSDPSGRFLGSGMCTYRNPADAKLAVHQLNRALFDGLPLTVAFAKEHGVVLTHELQRHAARKAEAEGALLHDPAGGGEGGATAGTASDAEGPLVRKWAHDKFQADGDAGERSSFRGRGRGMRGGGFGCRGGGRGGRGGGQQVDRVQEAFDRYVAARDMPDAPPQASKPEVYDVPPAPFGE